MNDAQLMKGILEGCVLAVIEKGETYPPRNSYEPPNFETKKDSLECKHSVLPFYIFHSARS